MDHLELRYIDNLSWVNCCYLIDLNIKLIMAKNKTKQAVAEDENIKRSKVKSTNQTLD